MRGERLRTPLKGGNVMDQEILKEAMDVADQLEGALRPIALTVLRLDTAETGGIPTVIVKQEGENVPSIACNVMPVEIKGVGMTFIQLYMTLTAPAPEDRQAELERFVKGVNERFMLGSLLVFQGGVCMRYTLALDPDKPLDPDHTQTTFLAFYQQAAVYAKLAGAVSNGVMTAEAALAHRE